MGKYCVRVGTLGIEDDLQYYKDSTDGVVEYLKDIGFVDESGSKDINENSYIDLEKLFTTYCASEDQLAKFKNFYPEYKITEIIDGTTRSRNLFNAFFKTLLNQGGKPNYEAYLKITNFYDKDSILIDSIALPGTRPHATKLCSLEYLPTYGAYYSVKRTPEKLTFYRMESDNNGYVYEFTAENFNDGVIPTRLLLVCLGGGGAGSSSSSSTPGAGGGSSGYVVGVLHLKNDQTYWFTVGGGGKGGKNQGGVNGEPTTITMERTSQLEIKGGKGGLYNQDTSGGAGGDDCTVYTEFFYKIQSSKGNAGGKPDGDSEAQPGENSNVSEIAIMSRADLNTKIITGTHSGGGIEGTPDYRGGGGGASPWGDGGAGNGSAGAGSAGDGYGSGGGGGALIFMGLDTNKGGDGANGVIQVYY